MKPNLIAASLIVILVSACSSAPKKAEETPPAPAAPPPAAATPAPAPQAETKPLPTPAETEAQKLDNAIHTLAGNSIYFDFDQALIKSEYTDTIKKDYEVLNAMPQMTARLEGNCDDRGSAEYNLALGQKRAEAVRKALGVMGIDTSRLEAISYGKEKPRCTEQTEQCWAENRRVDVVGK